LRKQKQQENLEQKKKINMVDEVFLQRAVKIRRQFLKVNNSMDFYAKRVNTIVESLDEILKKLDNLKEETSQDKNKHDKSVAERAALDLKKIIEDLEQEGKKLEGYISPLNDEVEKLALEEQELYRQIKEKNSHLTDDQIVESVKNRLQEENLS
jgi:predicted RNase H-like nuclease (RuvC/YqgF family)